MLRLTESEENVRWQIGSGISIVIVWNIDQSSIFITLAPSRQSSPKHIDCKLLLLFFFRPFMQGKVKCVAALLTRGADIRQKGPLGETALHFAALGGGALVARALVAAGADPRTPNEKGNTPVDVARYAIKRCARSCPSKISDKADF